MTNHMLSEVDKRQLVARKEQVYTINGKYMFSVSMTDRHKALLDNDGWERGKESWLNYRQRTEAERELENKKRYKFAADLVEAFNKMHNDPEILALEGYKKDEPLNTLPSFLYEINGCIFSGVHGDTEVTEDWRNWLNKNLIAPEPPKP